MVQKSTLNIITIFIYIKSLKECNDINWSNPFKIKHLVIFFININCILEAWFNRQRCKAK